MALRPQCNRKQQHLAESSQEFRQKLTVLQAGMYGSSEQRVHGSPEADECYVLERTSPQRCGKKVVKTVKKLLREPAALGKSRPLVES
ncbi:hypothetical protein NDU88_001896 [Pleurodeles waltl]|uniref:Uncharacterized protein n=1 Tax=Pleurodeles waltl TaxID=8319 RepID=A0AAV7MNZ3_PLEWA|nr:hypothetical protein NDU88_001896 [Pleurodeles waltl]